MAEPTEGMLYHVELDDAGEVLTIEAQQNGERVAAVEIARSAWPAIARAITEVEIDHDGESADYLERGKKRLLERIRAYQDGERDAEPNNAILRAQLGRLIESEDRWARLAERLAWHLADCHAVLRFVKVGYPTSHGDNGTKALADFRAMMPAGLTAPRDYQDAEAAGEGERDEG